MAEQRVLKIEKPDPGKPLALGQPDQILRMKITQHQAGLGRAALRQRVTPQPAPVIAHVVADRHARALGRVPVEKQFAFGNQRGVVILQHIPAPAFAPVDRVGKTGTIQSGQRINGSGVEYTLVRRVGDKAGKQTVAQILDDGQSLIKIGRLDAGRGKPALGQRFGDPGKGGDVVSRQPRRRRIAKLEPLLHRGAGRAARRFARRRGIHQDGLPGPVIQPEIAARRRVAGKGDDARIAPAMGLQKVVASPAAIVLRCRQDGSPIRQTRAGRRAVRRG